jgi:hypothetical protein
VEARLGIAEGKPTWSRSPAVLGIGGRHGEAVHPIFRAKKKKFGRDVDHSIPKD